MAGDEYTSASRGGLKLKGSSSSSGVKKHKKKKSGSVKPEGAEKTTSSKEISKGAEAEEDYMRDGDRELESRGEDGKTAAERDYEERRRRRLHERLQKEGPKTHKQRVEELNKYLSNLSEHHDMPRIGPG